MKRADASARANQRRSAVTVVECEESTSHCEGVGKVWACCVVFVVAKTSVGQRAMCEDPVGCPTCFREARFIPARSVQRRQTGNRQAILSRINMAVNPRDSESATSGIIQGKVFSAVFSGHEIRILARVKRALG
jgi:hypothetical protein